MRRSLIHYWRTHLGLVLGAAIASTALTGALLIGDSMRGSLRALALERLGHIDYALLGERFFRDEIAKEIPGTTAPVILLNGSARHATSQARASRVQIQGIDQRFTDLFPSGGESLLSSLQQANDTPFPSLVISASLQRELGAKIGDAILLSLQRQSQSHRESLFGRRATDDIVTTIRAVLTGILPDSGPGRFGLRPHQHLPLNAFVDLKALQQALDQPGQANTLLVGTTNLSPQELQQHLAEHLNLADLGLNLVQRENYIALESTRFILNAPTIATAITSGAEEGLAASTFLTYLANEISSNGRTVPYSTVTAVNDPAGLYLQEGQPAQALAEDELYLNAWTAAQLNAAPGDSVALAYYVVGPREELTTAQARFRLKGIVAMRALAVDRTLTPAYPGLQDEEDISAWDAPFPMDMGKIQPRDEAYWDRYGASPKAFVSGKTGQRLWRSKHGEATALRFYPLAEGDLVTDWHGLRENLLQHLSPESAGFSFRPVRQRAIQASAGATDFSGLFIGFSLFLIAAAALLLLLLCRFGLEQRMREVGLLLAIGYPLAAVRRRFFNEGLALTGLGALLGLAGAQLYAYLLLFGLRTWWLPAIGTPFLQLHSNFSSLGLGYLATLLLVALTIRRSISRFHAIPVRALLAGTLDAPQQRQHNRSTKLAAVGLFFALALSALATTTEAATAAALFFGSGAAALLALLALFSSWLHTAKHRELRSGLAIGIHNSIRNPGRSALSTALIACATFVIVAVGANRRVEWQEDPGTGGFSLLAEADIPLHQDLNSEMGRFELGLSANLSSTHFFPMRVLPGEDISCLNLYQPQTPRVLGVPSALIQRGGFPFQQTLEPTPAESENPWLLLNRDLGPEIIPAIGDFNSTQWILHKSLGEDVTIENEAGEKVALRLVGLLQGSLFQGELLIAEDRFTRHFPAHSGYGYFLVETNTPETVAAALEKNLGAYGFDTTTSAARLLAYHAIENTYLSTFQTLGGLGLILGTFGLGILLLRNVLERSGELATLSACGFRRARLAALLLYENGFLLLAGLAIGITAALIAVAPRLLDPSPFPWASLGFSLCLVLAAGLLASLIAVRIALRRPLLGTLKSE